MVKISDLQNRSTPVATDAIEIEVGGQAYQATLQAIADQLGPISSSVTTAPEATVITGDGSTTVFTVAHTHGTERVGVMLEVDDSGDKRYVSVDYAASTTDVDVTVDNPVLANAETATVIVWPFGGVARVIPTITADAHAALTVTGDVESPVVEIATVSEPLTVTIDQAGKQGSTLVLVGDGTARAITWAGDTLLWAGSAPTATPATGRLVAQFADLGDGTVLASSQEFS